jgi:hypothetical protein
MDRDIKLANFNDMYTPDIALDYIKEFLPNKIYWEACYWLWHLAKALEKRNFKVVWNNTIDCLLEQPKEHWDIWFTNPPFNWNKKFINRAIELWKPFISLQRLEHLGWVEAMKLLWNLDFKIIIPEKRINYITPKMLKWEKVWWSPFHSIFICYKLNLPKKINYIKLTDKQWY